MDFLLPLSLSRSNLSALLVFLVWQLRSKIVKTELHNNIVQNDLCSHFCHWKHFSQWTNLPIIYISQNISHSTEFRSEFWFSEYTVLSKLITMFHQKYLSFILQSWLSMSSQRMNGSKGWSTSNVLVSPSLFFCFVFVLMRKQMEYDFHCIHIHWNMDVPVSKNQWAKLFIGKVPWKCSLRIWYNWYTEKYLWLVSRVQRTSLQQACVSPNLKLDPDIC